MPESLRLGRSAIILIGLAVGPGMTTMIFYPAARSLKKPKKKLPDLTVEQLINAQPGMKANQQPSTAFLLFSETLTLAPTLRVAASFLHSRVTISPSTAFTSHLTVLAATLTPATPTVKATAINMVTIFLFMLNSYFILIEN
jgi:hypothetical protein